MDPSFLPPCSLYTSPQSDVLKLGSEFNSVFNQLCVPHCPGMLLELRSLLNTTPVLPPPILSVLAPFRHSTSTLTFFYRENPPDQMPQKAQPTTRLGRSSATLWLSSFYLYRDGVLSTSVVFPLIFLLVFLYYPFLAAITVDLYLHPGEWSLYFDGASPLCPFFSLLPLYLFVNDVPPLLLLHGYSSFYFPFIILSFPLPGTFFPGAPCATKCFATFCSSKIGPHDTVPGVPSPKMYPKVGYCVTLRYL